MTRTDWRPTDLALIAAGGVLGAALRHGIVGGAADGATGGGGWFNYAPNNSVTFLERGIPWRLLVVNALGALLLGALLTVGKRVVSDRQSQLLRAGSTGFCGSLTTFSTLAIELASRIPAGSTVAVTLGTSIDGFTPTETDGSVYLARSPTAVTELVAIVILSLVSGGVAFLIGRVVVNRLVPSTPATPGETL